MKILLEYLKICFYCVLVYYFFSNFNFIIVAIWEFSSDASSDFAEQIMDVLRQLESVLTKF